MKTNQQFFAIALGLATLWVGAGCEKNHTGTPLETIQMTDTLVLAPGQAAEAQDGFRIVFRGMISDSRCPADALCIWPGFVDVDFDFVRDETAITDTLSMGGYDPIRIHPDIVQVFNRQIRLLQVSPEPPMSNQPAPRPEDYRVKLAVINL